MRKLINQEENLYCLDGEVITIDGVIFGGVIARMMEIM